MFVSIIIPVFKVEKYVERCVESVLSQTYRQLEVIFVDDCSPDRSIELAKNLINDSPKSKDLKFKFLQHDRNRGLSAARNTGIDAASGDYIYFLDSDDDLTANSIETLVQASADGSVDVICGALEMCGAVNMFEIALSFYNASYVGKKSVISAFTDNRIPMAAWNKLLRRDVIVSEKLYFKEGLLYEDNLWTFELAHCVNSLKTITNKTYHYWVHPSSIMTSTHNIQKYDYMLAVFAEREEFIKCRKLENPVTRNYLIKNKAVWIQCRICDGKIAFRERWRLAASVLSLNDKGLVLCYSILYIFRWVLHQIKCFVCH